MDILPEPIAFEWDKGNIPKNLHKHDVTPQEAEEMFSNSPLVLTYDAIHSGLDEARFWAFGTTKAERKLFAAFTLRGNKIRVISVRNMTKLEEEVYEDFEEDS